MWALATRSRLPHISRTPVTPLTRNKGPNVGSVLDHAAWTCMSHKPGMRNLPVASSVSPPFGIWTPRLGPSDAMPRHHYRHVRLGWSAGHVDDGDVGECEGTHRHAGLILGGAYQRSGKQSQIENGRSVHDGIQRAPEN